jgi:diguanylate cyclase (GGDEF)-like protein
VIEDDSVTRLTLEKVLRQAGYHVMSAASGEEGLACFREVPPLLVLLDVLLPGIDGFSVCREMRREHDPQQLPILMLTGLDDVDSIETAFEAGATDFITKPINWSLLSQRVRYALRTRALGDDLRRNQERLSHAQRIAKLGYWEYELKEGKVHCSPELLHVLKLSPEWAGMSLDDYLALVPDDERERLRSVLVGAIEGSNDFRIEHRLQRGDGAEIVVLQQGGLEYDRHRQPSVMKGILQDITERKKAEALIEYQAFYDSLTDLPNRRLFNDHLQHALELSKQHHSTVAVLFVGLDRFKMINDSLSHSAGDLLLQEVAGRLKALTEEGMSVARFGSDVFAVLYEAPNGMSNLDKVAQRLLGTFAGPFTLAGQEIFVTASVGIALYPFDCEGRETLLKAADGAMSRAKESGGGGYAYFTPDMNQRARHRLTLESELRKAIERDEFEIFYQPQIDTESRRIISMEALLRWRHPEKGLVSPLEFIPAAEESGLIVPIGEQVLMKACAQTAEWNRHLKRPIQVGVNLSARQFACPELLSMVERALEQSGMAAELLDLEVTESIAMKDVDACIYTLQALHEMGVKSSMDDFGTGYSSLSYLQQLPLHTLKIDRAFVKGINGNGENGGIAKAVIAMAHSLGMQVIAEGVETEEQFSFLRSECCDAMQGFLFSPPLDAAAMEKLLIASMDSGHG